MLCTRLALTTFYRKWDKITTNYCKYNVLIWGVICCYTTTLSFEILNEKYLLLQKLVSADLRFSMEKSQAAISVVLNYFIQFWYKWISLVWLAEAEWYLLMQCKKYLLHFWHCLLCCLFYIKYSIIVQITAYWLF